MNTDTKQTPAAVETWKVTVVNAGVLFYLKGTTWTGDKDRADSFTTKEAAQAAAAKAEEFMHPRIRKSYKVEVRA